jgi:hypothetical protein
MEDVFEFVRECCVALCAIIILCKGMPTLPEPRADIMSLASMDLSLVGRYDERLRISVKFWIYAIEVAVYESNHELNIIDILRKWNNQYNVDNDNYIYNGIEDAHTLFLKDLDDARRNREVLCANAINPNDVKDTHVTFHVSKEYDFHVYPKSFMYNDYIDADALLEQIDRIIKGEVTNGTNSTI